MVCAELQLVAVFREGVRGAGDAGVEDEDVEALLFGCEACCGGADGGEGGEVEVEEVDCCF